MAFLFSVSSSFAISGFGTLRSLWYYRHNRRNLSIFSVMADYSKGFFRKWEMERWTLDAWEITMENTGCAEPT